MSVPATMTAVILTGHGGLEKLELREDVPVPQPQPGWVLINVTAAGVNNTDINTRTGWYNKQVTTGTTVEGGAGGFGVAEKGMGDWEGGLTFPRIQGADAVGRIVAVGDGVGAGRIGERVVVQPYIRDPEDTTAYDSAGFLGSEYDGAFAQYVAAPSENVRAVSDDLPLSDAQLATLPCSGGTAMNMLVLAEAGAGDMALVTGASGGVGTFLIQILKALGANWVAGIAAPDKHEALFALGADQMIARSDSIDPAEAALEGTGGKPYTLVADVVGGPQFSRMLAVLGRGGRYVTSGAIAGPIVELDLRTLYLKNLSFFGSSAYRREAFPKLIELANAGKLSPAIAATYPLHEIKEAQTAFLGKTHIGSYVLIPPAAGGA